MIISTAEGQNWWSNRGYDLYGVIPLNELPEELESQFKRVSLELSKYKSLVLIGNSGPRMWEILADKLNGYHESSDVFDFSSRQAVLDWSNEELNEATYRLLYPTSLPVSLQTMGAYLGWSHPSPLGLGIHPTYGLWFAYRAAFLVDAALEASMVREDCSPCDSCLEKPCLSACPPKALSSMAPPSLSLCSGYRLKNGSPCATSCMARFACPVGKEYRYAKEQMKYHSLHSLETIRRWMESSGEL